MKIKRLSLIITLALCITVGSVYASWTYAEEQVASADDSISLGIDAAANSGAAGLIAVDASGLTIDIVDGGSYNTKLEVKGSVSVTFTPDERADSSVLPTGFKWNLTASAAALSATHGGDKIITSVTDTATAFTLDGDNKATISADAIKALISLNEITLETLSEHDEYRAVIESISNGAFTLTVSAVYN